ncbi:nucleoside triphosphate pyrophosphohydrolase family protein [Hymenobacter actinosclerus]|uniref:NTP pyrophosphatase, house-cleaning of non-canonical NTPs n=1 Tax=Hymenobacter actinosclerus TaxID=82805 RepID=A0A1I0JBX3_9BACT|nr:nucleoside triphosphate pyrophosphohydrolase family protein [Hymenobacter actinosclerus]SEU06682.1 NTP pyrophosphatase, house-cleaning of non-canonical NTPs [Hymenobacter actinosclerus]
MNLNEYQEQAILTDLNPGREGMMISLLGLAGEVGELLSEYKKFLRDGEAHQLFDDKITEELGDLLWYIASVSYKFDIDLAEVARRNIEKNRSRWGVRTGHESSVIPLYDESCQVEEQLPRIFFATVDYLDETSSSKVQLLVNGKSLGDPLSDNAYDEDGYRYHDIFHLAFAGVLGWSPVMRKLMDVKRKSNASVDQIEDGGRATAIEEGIAALIFSNAKSYNFFEGVREVDINLLKTIKELTSHLEVSSQSLGQWEKAILSGFDVWRQVVKRHTGRIEVDLIQRSISFISEENLRKI